MDKPNRRAWAIVVAIILGVIVLLYSSIHNVKGKYDGFAQCLSDKKIIFYGAFWCPHCQNQKKEFGSSAKYLPYVECSTPNGQGQNDTCKNESIRGYPTWVFPDSSRLEGEVPLDQLASKSGCALPQ